MGVGQGGGTYVEPVLGAEVGLFELAGDGLDGAVRVEDGAAQEQVRRLAAHHLVEQLRLAVRVGRRVVRRVARAGEPGEEAARGAGGGRRGEAARWVQQQQHEQGSVVTRSHPGSPRARGPASSARGLPRRGYILRAGDGWVPQLASPRPPPRMRCRCRTPADCSRPPPPSPPRSPPPTSRMRSTGASSPPPSPGRPLPMCVLGQGVDARSPSLPPQEIFCIVEGGPPHAHPFRRARDALAGDDDFTATHSPWTNRCVSPRPPPPLTLTPTQPARLLPPRDPRHRRASPLLSPTHVLTPADRDPPRRRGRPAPPRRGHRHAGPGRALPHRVRVHPREAQGVGHVRLPFSFSGSRSPSSCV